MELSPTAKVILGALAVEPRSGYDIKRLVDKATRFFWAASYGQIYPELKRLAAAGLVTEKGSAGERGRTVYRATSKGREALEQWLRSPEQALEMRDEGLLKLFFVGLLEPDDAIAVLEAKRRNHEAKLEQLRAIEPHAKAAERFGPHAVLGYGRALSEFATDWCEQQINELKGRK